MSNAPNDDPDEFTVRYERQRAERMRKAEELKRNAESRVAYLCGAMRFFGVERVYWTFDGPSEPATEGATFDPPVRDQLPFGLGNAVDEIWGDLLPAGWQSNAGMFGTLTLAVASGKVIDDIEIREEWDEEEME